MSLEVALSCRRGMTAHLSLLEVKRTSNQARSIVRFMSTLNASGGDDRHLATGGAGFVGCVLCPLVLSLRWTVWARSPVKL